MGKISKYFWHSGDVLTKYPVPIRMKVQIKEKKKYDIIPRMAEMALVKKSAVASEVKLRLIQIKIVSGMVKAYALIGGH